MPVRGASTTRYADPGRAWNVASVNVRIGGEVVNDVPSEFIVQCRADLRFEWVLRGTRHVPQPRRRELAKRGGEAILGQVEESLARRPPPLR